MEWVASAGGPLICVERDLADLWRGANGSSEPADQDEASPTDYDRACEVREYAGLVAMPNERSAIVLGDMPMTTAVWLDRAGRSIVVRAMYANSDEDIERALTSLDESNFQPSDESLLVSLRSSPLVIFDSAWPGVERRETIEFHLSSGRYRLTTKYTEPDETMGLVLHRFEPLHH